MAGWTAVAIWAYAEPRRRTTGLLLADLAVAEALILVSPLVKGEGMQATVPGFWVMGALFAWAIHWRWLGGLVAGVLLSVADLAVRSHVTQANYGNVFLLMIGGPIVGFMCESLARMADERDRAERAAAAAAERARLARAVHDGVLQVLALVQRRGAELGGDAADLGRLAGEQEAALRTLIRRQDALVEPTAGSGRRTGRPDVGPVPPGGHPAGDGGGSRRARAGARRRWPTSWSSVVSACLDNVAAHVGEDAPAWVLLEAFVDRLALSVRDEGPGIPDGRLDQAAREGRLGVTESIRGRIADLVAPPTWSPARSVPSGSSAFRVGVRARRFPR